MDDMCLNRKRRREEILSEMEVAKLEVGLVEIKRQMEDGKLAIEERRMTLEERKLTYSSSLLHALGSTGSLNELANSDDNITVYTKNHIKNLLFNCGVVDWTQQDKTQTQNAKVYI